MTIYMEFLDIDDTGCYYFEGSGMGWETNWNGTLRECIKDNIIWPYKIQSAKRFKVRNAPEGAMVVTLDGFPQEIWWAS